MSDRYGGERGASGVEAAIAITALLAMLMFIVGALRISGTSGDVTSAAHAGARAAAGEYGPTSGSEAAQRVVADILANRDVACANVAVSTTGDWSPGGVVTVDVSCTIRLGDVVLAGFPGERVANGRGVEVVDSLRAGR